MKFTRAMLILGVIILVISGGIIYSQKSKYTFTSSNQIKAVKIEQKGLNIVIDPRIELLSAVQLNSKYNLLTTMDFEYKKHMQEYFSNFVDAKAVKTFKNMSSRGFSFDAPPHSMLYYSYPPMLKKQADVSKELLSRSGGALGVNNFIEDLKVYSKESNFNKFYEDNSNFYKTIVNAVAKDINEFDIVLDLESYYGKKQNSYNLILSPILFGGGYGPRVEVKDGSYDVYGIIGPVDVKDNIPQFDKDYILRIGWHEFGHSFVNHLTSKYQKEIMKYSRLYTPISEKMTNHAYSNWEICVNEHINRAVVARLKYIKFGEESYKQEINNNKLKGFFYIEAICEKLKFYENNRDKYKTFDNFYPEIIDLFKELEESNLGSDFYKMKYSGPLNALFFMDNPIVIILPTNEKDENVEKQIAEYVTTVKSHIPVLKDVETITDKDALNRDLIKNNIIAYGTIDGNLWLSKYKDGFPFVINNNIVTLDKDYKSGNLRFITGIPSPVNCENALEIYTAQEAIDIVGINKIDHGTTDYVLVKDEVALASGNYINKDRIWSIK